MLFSSDTITPSQLGSVIQGIMPSFLTFRSGTKKSMSTKEKWKGIRKNTIEEGKQEGFPDGKEKRESGGCFLILPSGWCSYGLVLPCTNLFKYWLSVAPSRIELPSVNGSHLLWEVINPQKKDTPQSATDGLMGGIQKTGGECYTSCSRAHCVIKEDQISAETMSLLTLFAVF